MAGAAGGIRLGVGFVVAEGPDGPVGLVEVRGLDGELLEAAVIDPRRPDLEHVDAALELEHGAELELTFDPDLEQEG